MDIDQSDNQLAVIPQVDIAGLCASSLYPGSTYMEYTRIMSFVETDPDSLDELPDSAFSVLFIHCRADINDDDPSSAAESPRQWYLNLQFLIDAGKLNLVTEIRVVMHDESHQPLELDMILKEITADIGGPLPNVRSILFLGQGIFTAGRLQTAFVRSKNARKAVEHMVYLFPRVNSVKYHLLKEWVSSSGHNHLLSANACPLYGLTVKAYIHQLEHIQLFIGTPLPSDKFFEGLISLSIDVQHFRQHTGLPLIPTNHLRILALHRIYGVIPWALFKSPQGVLSFDVLKVLCLQFTQRSKHLVPFPGSDYNISSPKLKELRVIGLSYVYDDILGYFLVNDILDLTIFDEPSGFDRINKRALETVNYLNIGNSTRPRIKNRCSAASVDHLFALKSNLRMAVISWFGWPLPLHIEWTNLNNLNFSASIATKDGIANLIVQLPVLQFIKIDCESMCIDDAAASAFPDQANRNTMAIYTLRARKSSPISQCLEQFHIISQKNFDIEGFCELVALLPRIARIKVNFYHVQDVQAMLPRYVEAARSIDISAYPYAF